MGSAVGLHQGGDWTGMVQMQRREQDEQAMRLWRIMNWLRVGDWNHGILNDFPIILGMSSSQLTHILQRDWNRQLDEKLWRTSTEKSSKKSDFSLLNSWNKSWLILSTTSERFFVALRKVALRSRPGDVYRTATSWNTTGHQNNGAAVAWGIGCPS